MKHFKKGFNTTMGVFAAILTAGLIDRIVGSIVVEFEKSDEEDKDKEAEE